MRALQGPNDKIAGAGLDVCWYYPVYGDGIWASWRADGDGLVSARNDLERAVVVWS